MSIDLDKTAAEAAPPPVLAKRGELPRWALWAIRGGAKWVMNSATATASGVATRSAITDERMVPKTSGAM